MPKTEYAAEEAWLSSFFEYDGYLDLSVEVQARMIAEGVSLPDVMCALRDPTIIEYEREYHGCIIVVEGRTCDDERITIYGGFSSEMMIVSVFDVARTR